MRNTDTNIFWLKNTEGKSSLVELDVKGEDNSELALEGVKLTDLAQDSSNNGSCTLTFVP
jgi:hypothetical protein